MRKLLSIICLTVALSVNASPANAKIPWALLKPILEGFATVAAEAIIEAITTPQDNAFHAFTDEEWLVTVSDNDNDLVYHGVNLETGDSITLAGVVYGGNSERRVFSWNNGNFRYQIAQQPADPDFVRLQVFEGNAELLNRLLYRYEPH